MFADSETRDRVASYARNLGAFVEGGKPTATFRHEVPTHLGGVYKTLLQYGFKMASRYGKDFKRNIRYDDVALSFCIDVLLPGAASWVTVSYERALQDRKDQQKIADGKKDGSLSSMSAGVAEDGAEERAQAPVPSPAPAAAAAPAGTTQPMNESRASNNNTWGMYR